MWHVKVKAGVPESLTNLWLQRTKAAPSGSLSCCQCPELNHDYIPGEFLYREICWPLLRVHTLCHRNWPEPSTRFMLDPNRSHQSWCHVWRLCQSMCVTTGTGLNYWMCYCMRGFSMRWMFSCAVQYINLVLGMQPHISQLIMRI